jgi:hypothetical protein
VLCCGEGMPRVGEYGAGRWTVPCVKDPTLVPRRPSSEQYPNALAVNNAPKMGSRGKRLTGKLYEPFDRADGGRATRPTSSDSTLGGRESRSQGEAAIRSLEMAHAPGMRDMDRRGL